MEADFRALVLAAAAAQAGERVHWAERPQGGALPAVVLHLISRAEAYTQKGPDGLVMQRVQADCIALSFGAAVALRDAVIGALSGWRGIAGGTDFQGVFLDGARGRSEADDALRLIFTQQIDFLVHHKER